MWSVHSAQKVMPNSCFNNSNLSLIVVTWQLLYVIIDIEQSKMVQTDTVFL